MTWINFNVLRKGLSFEKVLQLYGVDVRRKAPGNRHVGFCPLPTHQGKRRSPSFSAKLDFGVWQCFGCKASGNVLDFAVRMEGLDPQDRQHLRQVSLRLQQTFHVPGASDRNPGKENRSAPKPRSTPPPQPPAAPAKPKLPVVVNQPLDFELKDLDPEHPYLTERGFQRETIRHFGLGYCNRGLMKGRVAIPLHDHEGRLVGYGGRLVDDSVIDADHPKYLLPGPREREGKLYEFRKSLLLYNGWHIQRPVDELIVVEGFPACWWLWQWGYPNTVALMGSDCSDEQAKLIAALVSPAGRAWLFPDSGPGGEHCASSALARVAPHRFVRWVKCAGQPTDRTPGDLSSLLWPI
jgi:DNA primase